MQFCIAALTMVSSSRPGGFRDYTRER